MEIFMICEILIRANGIANRIVKHYYIDFNG